MDSDSHLLQYVLTLGQFKGYGCLSVISVAPFKLAICAKFNVSGLIHGSTFSSATRRSNNNTQFSTTSTDDSADSVSWPAKR